MPRTSPVTSVSELESIKIFDPAAAYLLITKFNEGKKIEKVESSFSDPGDDYVDFQIDGQVVCHIKGY